MNHIQARELTEMENIVFGILLFGMIILIVVGTISILQVDLVSFFICIIGIICMLLSWNYLTKLTESEEYNDR